VADYFIDLGDIAELVSKDDSSTETYDIPTFVPPGDVMPKMQSSGRENSPPRVSDNIRFETNFNEIEEAENELSDLIRVTDER
jgi:hypothetical protein